MLRQLQTNKQVQNDIDIEILFHCSIDISELEKNAIYSTYGASKNWKQQNTRETYTKETIKIKMNWK